MKRARRLIIIGLLTLVVVVAAIIAYQRCIVPLSEWYPEDAIMDGPPDVLLESIQVGGRTAQFYIDYSRDFAVFGYFVEDDTGRPRYFPLDGSSFRGLRRKTVEVFLSDTQEEMWVQVGTRATHYFHASNDFITKHGRDVPTPSGSFSTSGSGPPLSPEAKKVLSFTAGEDY